ncbi:MAG: terminase small subunit [Planctomycetes bacterium]|nr:terminase small subunit [Planctomycetota bacterium]
MDTVKLNKTELAKSLGVSLTTIQNWMRQGLPHQRRGDGDHTLQFDLAEVFQWRMAQKDRSFKARPEGYQGTNCFRDLCHASVTGFFEFVVNNSEMEFLKLFNGSGLNKKEGVKLWEKLYFLLADYFYAWINGDMLDERIGRDGQDLDVVWRSLVGSNAEISKEYKPDFKIPESIRKLFDSDGKLRRGVNKVD